MTALVAAAGLVVDRSRRSPNHGERAGSGRPDCIVLHYTGMRDEAAAVDWLCAPASQVSCHYVVTEAGRLLQLVDEERRAWHAGRSFWCGDTDLNSASVGIEIVNGGHDFGLPAYPEPQIDAVIALCRDLMRRHAVAPARILAHSDIAPGRKRDPGERFPWRRLAEAGVGTWPDPSASEAPEPPQDVALARDLTRIGYGLPPAVEGIDLPTVLRAFQRRYRPEKIDGIADRETVALIGALLRQRGSCVPGRNASRAASVASGFTSSGT